VASRRELLAELERYVAFDEREREMVERLRAFVEEHARCFERALAIGHVTGSAWVVDLSGRFALLTHHRKLGRWLQLGGHADGEADVRAVARREALEESGLRELEPAGNGIYDVDVHEIGERPGEPAHLHYDVRFAFFADQRSPLCASAESHEVTWIPLDRLADFGVDASVRRLAAKTPTLVGTEAQRGAANLKS